MRASIALLALFDDALTWPETVLMIGLLAFVYGVLAALFLLIFG